MTLDKLLEKLNKIVSENSEMGKLQVYTIEQAECRIFNSVDVMLVDKKQPTENFPLDYHTLICDYDNFKKEDYAGAIVLGWNK